MGEVEVVIMDPTGKKNTVECAIEDKGNSSYRCTYKPTLEGQHIVYVTFSGGAISKSPFSGTVGEGEEGEGGEGGRRRGRREGGGFRRKVAFSRSRDY